MNRSKYILAIAIAILGGGIMLESMISGISIFKQKSNEDFQTYDVERQALQAPIKIPFFSIEKGQTVSVWLRYANRRIENKNLKIALSLIDEDGVILREFQKDFRFGHFRGSAKPVRFFKLGEYAFTKEFRGYLQYELGGTWTPTPISAFVVRISPPVFLPLRQIGFFIVGLSALIVGMGTLKKNLIKQIPCKKDKQTGSKPLTNEQDRSSTQST